MLQTKTFYPQNISIRIFLLSSVSLLKAAVFQCLQETVFLQQLANQQPELFLCLIPAAARVKIYLLCLPFSAASLRVTGTEAKRNAPRRVIGPNA